MYVTQFDIFPEREGKKREKIKREREISTYFSSQFLISSGFKIPFLEVGMKNLESVIETLLTRLHEDTPKRKKKKSDFAKTPTSETIRTDTPQISHQI